MTRSQCEDLICFDFFSASQLLDDQNQSDEETIYSTNDVLYTILSFLIKGKPPGFSNLFASYAKEHEDSFFGLDESGNVQYSYSSPLVLVLSNIVKIIDTFPICTSASLAANRFINLIDSLKRTFECDVFDDFLNSKIINNRLKIDNSAKKSLTEVEITNEFLNKFGKLQEIDFYKPNIIFDFSESYVKHNFLDPDKEYYSSTSGEATVI